MAKIQLAYKSSSPSADAAKPQNVSVFGLGKVGLVLAGCLSNSGCRVVGFDPNAEHVDNIAKRKFTSSEPKVNQFVKQSLDTNLFVTADVKKAIAESDATFIIVPTPSNALGGFSLKYVRSAITMVAEQLRGKKGYHLVSLVSTVLPGSSEFVIMPMLEEISGKKIGVDLGFAYNPAFIALGEVARGFMTPDYVLIGESDPHAGEITLQLHRAMVQNDAPIARMKPTEAEITKIASNTHETMRVAYANMLFSLCSEIPGTNVDRITAALSHRMGKRFFKGAVPYGGPCWPRDNIALAAFMDSVGVPSLLPKTVDLCNAEHGKYLLRKILALTERGEKVSLIGLAYKPGTNVTEKAFALDLARWLIAEEREVIGWDPLAMPTVKQELGDKITYATTPEECLKAGRVAIILNPLAELDAVDWSKSEDRIVIDCWRCLSPVNKSKITNYVPLGQGSAQELQDLVGKIGSERLKLLMD